MSVIQYFLIVYIICVSARKPRKKFYDVKHAQNMFEDFVEKFNITYSTKAEYKFRFDMFRENLKDINRRNRKSKTVEFGINSFTDLTKDEKNKRLFGLREMYEKDQCDITLPTELNLPTDAPEEWDWRDHDAVTRVRNQGECGACWAISAVGAIEGQHAIINKKLVMLSDQQLVDCSGRLNDCEGGLPHESLDAAAEDGGVASYKNYPYRGFKGTCRAEKIKKEVKVFKASTYLYHDYKTTEEELKLLLYHKGPVVFGMKVRMGYFDYMNGIAVSEDFDCRSSMPMTHAALLVGYGTENGTPYWTAKNSYGTDWGEYGYFRMKRGENTCDLTKYLVKAEIQDKNTIIINYTDYNFDTTRSHYTTSKLPMDSYQQND